MVSFQSNAQGPSADYSVATGVGLTDPFITVFATRNPTPNDFNYPVKKRWINLTPGQVSEWVLTGFNNTSGQSLANWVLLTGISAEVTGQLNEQAGANPSPFITVTFNALTNTDFVNPMSSSRWIVDPLNIPNPNTPNGTHSTITSAMASAVAGDTIFVMPGFTYTESFTMTAGVNLSSFSSGGFGNNPLINGTVTVSSGGVNAISGIYVAAISVTGSAGTTCVLTSCKVGTVTNNNPNAVLRLHNSIYSVSGSNVFITASGGSTTILIGCWGNNNSSAPSINTSSSVQIYASYIQGMYNTSGTGSYSFNNCEFSSAGTVMTTAGTGSSTIANCNLVASGSVLSIGAGTTVTATNCTINTVTNPALTGLGTINYGSLVFVNNATNSVTNKTLLTVT